MASLARWGSVAARYKVQGIQGTSRLLRAVGRAFAFIYREP